MMKNRFKKLAILALSTVCLLANGATHGMNDEKDLNQSGFGSSSLGMSQLQQSFVSDLSQLTEEQMMLMSQLISSVRQGNNIDLSRSLSASSMGLSPAEREIKRLISNSKGVDLFPQLDPFKIMRLINEVLLPKYAAVLQGGFAKRTLNISEGDFEDVLDFLKTNKSFIMGDLCSPHPMILLLKMISHSLDLTPLTSNIQQNHHYGYQLPFPQSEMLLRDCSGIINRQFIVKMDNFYKSLKHLIDSQYFHGMGQDQQQTKEKIINEVTKDLNRKMSYTGYEFKIDEDAKEVSQIIQNWVKVVRQLVSFELREWEGKEASYRQLQECYDFASQQLLAAQSNQTLYFSGVVKTPYTIALIEVEKPEQASSLDFINQRVDFYKKSDEKKLYEYNGIKEELSSLKKLQNWFDDLFGDVAKKGRMS